MQLFAKLSHTLPLGPRSSISPAKKNA